MKIFINQQGTTQFYLFKCQDYFNALIGINNFKRLAANLDFQRRLLVTPNTNIKLLYHKVTSSAYNNISFAARVEHVIKIKTSVKEG